MALMFDHSERAKHDVGAEEVFALQSSKEFGSDSAILHCALEQSSVSPMVEAPPFLSFTSPASIRAGNSLQQSHHKLFG